MAAGRVRVRAFGAQGREVGADTAAQLHRERRFAQRIENAVERIVQRPHHEAVEQRDPPRGSGARHDASARQEAEIRERFAKACRPARAIVLSTAASAFATRSQVASIDASGAPSGRVKR